MTNQTDTSAPAPLRLVVEGWRDVNHSIALVNQFQLLELVQRADVQLTHIDAPYVFKHWSAAKNGSGLLARHQQQLRALSTQVDWAQTDWLYRIAVPIRLQPYPDRARMAVFAVTEMGFTTRHFNPDFNIDAFEAAGHHCITPSRWSAERAVDYGFSPDHVHVVPHAVSPDYFFPIAPERIAEQRKGWSYQPEHVVLLNIAAPVFAKGVDVLLRAFAIARQKRKDLFLILKDQRSTYQLSGASTLHKVLEKHGLLSDDVLSAVRVMTNNLTMSQMRMLYAVADCYVSPYRAEGFNLPVAEAIACGTPVLVTKGGATADFVHQGPHRLLRGTFYANKPIFNGDIATYHEPDLDHLVQLLLDTPPKPSRQAGAELLPATPGWGPIAEQLVQLLRRL